MIFKCSAEVMAETRGCVSLEKGKADLFYVLVG